MLLQISLLYTFPPKVWFSVSMWKSSYFNRVTIEIVWKLKVLLQIFVFDWKYLCRCQLWIYVDVRYSFKASHDKVINSWNVYWNWIKCFLRDKFLVELIHFCRYQGYISLYQAKIQFSISMERNHIFIKYMWILILEFENSSCYCGYFKLTSCPSTDTRAVHIST